jgi:hypothetical protein
MKLRTPLALLALAPVAVCLPACDTGPDTLFEVRSARTTGIDFANVLEEDDSVYNPLDFDYLYNGAGVALGDVNGDGLLDVYFGGNMVSSRLYLNQGDLRFEDVTEAAGAGTTAWATGVSMVDINQDGLLDIYVCVAGLVPVAERGNLLFINQGVDEKGVPRFEERAREYGLDDTGYSTHAAFLDYDRDGDLDVYLLTNALEDFNRNTMRPRRTSGQATSTDRLYRNNGDGMFIDVSREAGILSEGYGLGVGVSDLNRDGWPDIYVANDFLSNDLIWVNNGDGTFTDRAQQYLTHMTHNGMGMDAADYDNDGLVDIVVLDMLPPDNLRKKMMLMGGNYDKFHMGLDLGYARQYMRNTLQHNLGPGPDGQPHFAEIGQLAGIDETDWSWAPLFADFDLDGRKDLFVSNGYRRDVTNLDFILYLQDSLRTNDPVERARLLRQKLRELPEVELPNHIFRNNGDLTFDDRSEAWGVDVRTYSNGAAYGDLDNDGDLDLVVSNLDQPALVYENRARQQQTGHYLTVKLRGPASNPTGFGATVSVEAGGERQVMESNPFRGYKSTMDPRLHLGLGQAAEADEIEVVWVDGRRQVVRGVTADTVIVLDHAMAEAPGADPSPPERPTAEPLFGRVTGIDAAHVEREVVDFRITPLLPHKFSMGGPGVAVGDVDGDGSEDVFIGADRGYSGQLLLQTAPGAFAAAAAPDAEAFEDMGVLLFDADGDGHNDLYAVSGGSFAVDTPEQYRDRLYVNDGTGALHHVQEALPAVTASGSTVGAADYDGDGDLDLFVAGRIEPGRYPMPPRSYLLRNDSRPGTPRFTDVTEEVAPGLLRPGLVHTALWTDYDGDGRPDLLLAGEWMPLTLFRNTGAGFQDVTDDAGLRGTEGWWRSLVSGDFDDDGDTDYVAGNLGLNTKYSASPEQPVRVHAADFDENGSIDPVLSRFIDGRSYAVGSRDQLIDQMMAMGARFPSYIEYAGATLEETLSEAERDRALVLSAVRFESSFLENRGDGTFAVRSLPMAAQIAPVYGMLTGDFDDDGDLDLVAVGNTSSPDIETGQYTASYGLLLRGDGRGQFRVDASAAAGFFVEGEGRAITGIATGASGSTVLVTRNDNDAVAFHPLRQAAARRVQLSPLESHAILSLADGGTRRVELMYGSGYLSQSSRVLVIPEGAREVVIHDSQGGRRVITF